MQTRDAHDEIEPRLRMRMFLIVVLLGLSPLPLQFLYATYAYREPAVAHLVSFISTLLRLGCLSFFLWFPFALVAISKPSWQSVAAAWIPTNLLFLATPFFSLFLTVSIHNHSFNAALPIIIKNSIPLITAIEAYELDHAGEPPASLDDLVPKYIADVPHTGIGCYPNYILLLPDDIPSWYPKSRWILEVQTSRGFIDGDSLYFLPDQNYDDTPMRESVTLMPLGDGRDWGFFNE